MSKMSPHLKFLHMTKNSPRTMSAVSATNIKYAKKWYIFLGLKAKFLTWIWLHHQLAAQWWIEENIARVRNCPDVAIVNSLFGLCLLSFCLFVFFLSFCLFVLLYFCLFVFSFLSFCLFVIFCHFCLPSFFPYFLSFIGDFFQDISLCQFPPFVISLTIVHFSFFSLQRKIEVFTLVIYLTFTIIQENIAFFWFSSF